MFYNRDPMPGFDVRIKFRHRKMVQNRDPMPGFDVGIGINLLGRIRCSKLGKLFRMCIDIEEKRKYR